MGAADDQPERGSGSLEQQPTHSGTLGIEYAAVSVALGTAGAWSNRVAQAGLACLCEGHLAFVVGRIDLATTMRIGRQNALDPKSILALGSPVAPHLPFVSMLVAQGVARQRRGRRRHRGLRWRAIVAQQGQQAEGVVSNRNGRTAVTVKIRRIASPPQRYDIRVSVEIDVGCGQRSGVAVLDHHPGLQAAKARLPRYVVGRVVRQHEAALPVPAQARIEPTATTTETPRSRIKTGIPRRNSISTKSS